MIYTPNINKALKLITEVHKNQVDKAGVAYILHPFIVAESAINFCHKFSTDIEKVDKSQILEDIIVSALLHDVVEDSNITFDDLEKQGFNSNVIKALRCLTHNKNEDYDDYIHRMIDNAIAIVVKMADLRHNMCIDRMDKTIFDKRFLTKQNTYNRAYGILSDYIMFCDFDFDKERDSGEI